MWAILVLRLLFCRGLTSHHSHEWMPDTLSLPAVTSEDEDDGMLRQFLVKREYAEGSIIMSMGKFPAAALPEPGQPAPMMYRYSHQTALVFRKLCECAPSCEYRPAATAFGTSQAPV